MLELHIKMSPMAGVVFVDISLQSEQVYLIVILLVWIGTNVQKTSRIDNSLTTLCACTRISGEEVSQSCIFRVDGHVSTRNGNSLCSLMYAHVPETVYPKNSFLSDVRSI